MEDTPGWLDEGAETNEPFLSSGAPPPPARGVSAEAVPVITKSIAVVATPIIENAHNPFEDDDDDNNDDNVHPAMPAAPLGAGGNSSNPFGDEEDDTTPSTNKTQKPPTSSYNPFGDVDEDSTIMERPGPQQRKANIAPPPQQKKPSIALPPRLGTMDPKSSGPSGVGILGDPSGPKRAANLTFDNDKKNVGSSILLPKDLRTLCEMGFEVNAAREELNKAGSVALAQQRLYAGVNQFGNGGSSNGLLWRPPLAIRVGSWLPNIASDREASDFHTGYIATVSICCSNISWQITHRYSNYRDLYENVMRVARKEKVQVALTAQFPMDRLHNVFFGMTDEVRNRRQGQIDVWLKELLTTPAYMANAAIQNVVVEFLEARPPMRASTDAQLISRGDSSPDLTRGIGGRSMGNPF